MAAKMTCPICKDEKGLPSSSISVSTPSLTSSSSVSSSLLHSSWHFFSSMSDIRLQSIYICVYVHHARYVTVECVYEIIRRLVAHSISYTDCLAVILATLYFIHENIHVDLHFSVSRALHYENIHVIHMKLSMHICQKITSSETLRNRLSQKDMQYPGVGKLQGNPAPPRKSSSRCEEPCTGWHAMKKVLNLWRHFLWLKKVLSCSRKATVPKISTGCSSVWKGQKGMIEMDILHNVCWVENNNITNKISTALFEGNTQATGGSPHRGPAIRKTFPCYDDILLVAMLTLSWVQRFCWPELWF